MGVNLPQSTMMTRVGFLSPISRWSTTKKNNGRSNAEISILSQQLRMTIDVRELINTSWINDCSWCKCSVNCFHVSSWFDCSCVSVVFWWSPIAHAITIGPPLSHSTLSKNWSFWKVPRIWPSIPVHHKNFCWQCATTKKFTKILSITTGCFYWSKDVATRILINSILTATGVLCGWRLVWNIQIVSHIIVDCIHGGRWCPGWSVPERHPQPCFWDRGSLLYRQSNR